MSVNFHVGYPSCGMWSYHHIIQPLQVMSPLHVLVGSSNAKDGNLEFRFNNVKFQNLGHVLKLSTIVSKRFQT